LSITTLKARMSETSATLLGRLRAEPHSEEWERLVAIYTPLIRNWLRRAELKIVDGDDVVQDVMAVVVRRLPEFRHNGRTGAFRAWLRAITANCLRDHVRARRQVPKATGDSDFAMTLAQLEDPESALSRQWDEEHQVHVTRMLLEQLRPGFEAKTWSAFEEFAIKGRSAADVARELGTTPNAVFIAKSKILARLREEASDLLD
jgi:RNA polymerase sigma-70 factor (ECF subfamily)